MAVESHEKSFSEIKFRTESLRTHLLTQVNVDGGEGEEEILNGRNSTRTAACFRELDLKDLGNRSVFRQPQKHDTGIVLGVTE